MASLLSMNRHNGLEASYRKGLTDLSKATGKSVEKILLAVCKQAAEQRQEALEALEQGVPQLERCLVHDGSPLIHEYHSKVLGRLAKLTEMFKAESLELLAKDTPPAVTEAGS